MLESFHSSRSGAGGENLANGAQSNPEIFTVKENVPLAQPPVTTEEVLTLPADDLLSNLGLQRKVLAPKKRNEESVFTVPTN